SSRQSAGHAAPRRRLLERARLPRGDRVPSRGQRFPAWTTPYRRRPSVARHWNWRLTKMQQFRATLSATTLFLSARRAAPPAAAPAAAAPAQDDVRTGQGTGTVASLDAGSDAVTIDHGPMPDNGSSAMTMTFAVAPALLVGIAAGDRV